MALDQRDSSFDSPSIDNSTPEILLPGSSNPNLNSDLIVDGRGTLNSERNQPIDFIRDDKGTLNSEPQVEHQLQESSQNEVDLNKYNEEERTVKTESLVAADGERYYKDPKLGYDYEANQSIPLEDSRVAPEDASFVVATEKQDRQVKQNYWDNPEKIKDNFNTLEEAMSNDDAKRYNAFQDSGINQTEGMSVTEGSKLHNKHLQSREIPVEISEATKETLSLEEALKAGEPRYNIKVLRTSGDMDNDWFATGVFQDSNGVDRVRVWKELPDGTTIRKDVRLTNLNAWNSTETPIEPEPTPIEPEPTPIEPEPTPIEPEPTPIEPEPTPIEPEPTPVPMEGIEERLNTLQESMGNVENSIDDISQRIEDLLRGQELSNLTQEELLLYAQLMQQQLTLTNERTRIAQEENELRVARIQTMLEDINARLDNTPPIPPVTPPPTPPVTPPPTPPVTPPPIPPTPPTTPGGASAEVNQLRQEMDQLRQQNNELMGVNTPEQRLASTERRFAQLSEARRQNVLTDEERIEYLNLLNEREALQNQIGVVEQEAQEKRENKHKKIRRAAIVVGAVVAVATPPVSIAAVLAVTLGGPIVGRQIGRWSEKIRTKSRSMKYESREGKSVTELMEFDKKQQRKEWWANRLGEVSAVITGGTTGYGAGKALQGIWNMARSALSSTNATTYTPGETTAVVEEAAGTGMEPPIVEQPVGDVGRIGGHIEVPSPAGVGGAEGELLSGDWLRTGEFGWDTSQWGWNGPDLFVPQGNVVQGAVPDLQGRFVSELANLGVDKGMLMGQEAGNIFNQGLMEAAYRGGNLTEVASTTADALRNLVP